MTRCKTCKWFPDRPGVTEARCALLGTQGSMVRTENRSNTAARSLSGNSWLWVEQDFGCIRHEPRPKTTP